MITPVDALIESNQRPLNPPSAMLCPAAVVPSVGGFINVEVVRLAMPSACFFVPSGRTAVIAGIERSSTVIALCSCSVTHAL